VKIGAARAAGRIAVGEEAGRLSSSAMTMTITALNRTRRRIHSSPNLSCR